MKSIVLCLLFSAAFACGATEQPNCQSKAFNEVNSLADLPTDVSKLLIGTGDNEIADRGREFNSTDVILPGKEKLAFRRLGMAAANADRIFAAVEHGGRGYWVELWAFRRSGDAWRGEKLQAVSRAVPSSLMELLAKACK